MKTNNLKMGTRVTIYGRSLPSSFGNKTGVEDFFKAFYMAAKNARIHA